MLKLPNRYISLIIINLIWSIIILCIPSRNCYSNNNSDIENVQSFSKIISNTNQSQILTIKIHKTGWELGDPIIELNSNETISLIFDDLSDESTSYSYTIIHCDKDWQASNISFFDYLEGFEFNSISTSENSMSTTIPYTHYKIEIPNENIKLKISGNYLIRIVDSYENSKMIFESKFMVVEPLAKIKSSVTQPVLADKMNTSQQIKLSILTNSLKINDIQKELFTSIYQNNQPDNAQINIRPMFIQSNEITYSSADALIFDGLNEFRNFDIKSVRYNSPEIDNIIQNVDGFNVMLKPDENNRSTKYTYNPDINGHYSVKLEGSERSEIEADYVWVYFTLPYFEELTGKEVYVYGDISNWLCSPNYLMTYNYQRQAYELRLLLKQGYYNYRYVLRNTKTGKTDHAFFEGNHFDTENSYLVLAYLRQQGTKYDRLVGAKRISCRNSI